MTAQTETTTEEAAPRPRTRAYVARVEEWIFFTEVCGMKEPAAREALGASKEQVRRWRRYLADENPRLRAQVLAVYTGGEEWTG